MAILQKMWRRLATSAFIQRYMRFPGRRFQAVYWSLAALLALYSGVDMVSRSEGANLPTALSAFGTGVLAGTLLAGMVFIYGAVAYRALTSLAAGLRWLRATAPGAWQATITWLVTAAAAVACFIKGIPAAFRWLLAAPARWRAKPSREKSTILLGLGLAAVMVSLLVFYFGPAQTIVDRAPQWLMHDDRFSGFMLSLVLALIMTYATIMAATIVLHILAQLFKSLRG